MFRRRGHFVDTLLEKCNQMKRQNALIFLNVFFFTGVRHVMVSVLCFQDKKLKQSETKIKEGEN